MHKYESNASMLSRVIFYLKSVTFLFLFSINNAYSFKTTTTKKHVHLRHHYLLKQAHL